MNFFRRGFLSITRKLGKNVTLLILVFILGNIMIGAITIKQAVKNTEVSLKNKIGAIATIELDYDKLEDKNWNDIEFLKAEEIEKIGSLSYVKYYDYTSTFSLESTNLKRYGEEESAIWYEDDSFYPNYFSLTGVQNKEIFDIKQNKIKLLTGRTFNDDEINSLKNVVLISKTVADLNNLTIGSKITLSNTIYEYDPIPFNSMKDTLASGQKVYAKEDVEFEVVGIFEPVKTVKSGSDKNGSPDYDRIDKENRIYTTNKVINSLKDFYFTKSKEIDPENADSYRDEYLVPLYVLKDPLDLDKFHEEATKHMPSHYKIIDNSSSLSTISAPMENMDWIASIVLYVSMFATILIIGLLITLFIRDRKHEMGIYLSLGEKRKKVIFQILFELLIVAFVGMTLAIFSGSLIASSVSKGMLKNQIIADEENKNNGDVWTEGNTLDWMGYGNNLTTEEMIETYKVSISPLTILLFYSVGLGTVFISGVAPSIYIVRLNPKKIMM